MTLLLKVPLFLSRKKPIQSSVIKPEYVTVGEAYFKKDHTVKLIP